MSWRVGLRLIYGFAAAALIVLGVFWWLPLMGEGESDNQRGLYAPFLFAVLPIAGVVSTFAVAPKTSRSDAFMERARELHRPSRARKSRLVVLTTALSIALIVGGVAAILLTA